jgi:hypothetical protein
MELYLSWKKQLDQNTTNIKGINDLVGASVKLCKVLGFDFFRIRSATQYHLRALEFKY